MNMQDSAARHTPRSLAINFPKMNLNFYWKFTKVNFVPAPPRVGDATTLILALVSHSFSFIALV